MAAWRLRRVEGVAERGGTERSRRRAAIEDSSLRAVLSGVAAGALATVAILGSPVLAGDFPQLPSEGRVRCWGNNSYGQCSVPPDLGPVTAVAAAGAHTVALLADGSVRCWGANWYGQCSVPSDLGPVTAVATGNYLTVAVLADGSVRCWGSCSVPPDLGPVTAVAVGDFHTLALLADGSVRCWGSCSVPPDLGPVTAVAAGGSHTVALLADGSVRCWGGNAHGECSVPPDLGPVTAVAAGGSTDGFNPAGHTVVLLADGSVRCWGSNSSGQCSVPPDLGVVKAISAGNRHTVAVLVDGSVRCWGACSLPSDLGVATEVAGGGGHTVAIDVADLVVGQGGSIQSAIDAASDGDVIAVRPGTYPERLDFMGKAITLWGIGGADAVVIDSTGLPGSTVIVDGIHEQPAQLVGFTIRGGSVGTPVPGSSGLVGGGGLYLEQSNARIYDCRVEASSAAVGGGVMAFLGSPRLVRCVIEGNQSTGDGGGALLHESLASFDRCEFIDNVAGGRGGGLHATRGEPLVERSAFRDNLAMSAGGGASWFAGSTPMTLRRVAFAANDSKVGGPAAWVRPSFDNLILDDVAICGSGTQPILGAFTTIGPFVVVSACSDCNDNDLPDLGEVMVESVGDCNDNLVPDSCDIANGLEQDCNGNALPDACEIKAGSASDCNGNGVPDSCDIASGKSEDRNNEECSIGGAVGNGIPDECEVGSVIRLSYPSELYRLQDAICNAVDGVIIELEPGVWNTTFGLPPGIGDIIGIDLGSKRVTIRSVKGPEVTFLHAAGEYGVSSDTVVAIGPSAASGGIRPVLQGLTIRLGEGGTPFPGSATPVGAGLRLLDTDALIEDCIIELNFASGGAGVAIKGGSPILRDCIIRHNDSMGHGGGILLIDTNATIEDCTILDNIAIGRGGGVHAVGGSPTIEGTLLDYNDSASQGGGVSWMGTSAAGGRLLVDDCVVQDNLAVGGGGLWIKPGVSNLHLRATGLCGNEPEQILGAYVDLGGNGGCGVGCPADLTGDAEVNGADLTVLLSAWGPLGGSADLNGDGVVNGADLAALLAAWGSCQ